MLKKILDFIKIKLLSGNTVRRRLIDIDIIDPDSRRKSMRLSTYLAFFLVGFVMSIINVITKVSLLFAFTSSFSVLCLINYLLASKSKELEKVASYLFLAEIVILFSYFIVTGGTDNFSIVWLLLLPSLGMYFFGKKLGSILCAVILLIMLVCFHFPPIAKFCTDYGTTFTIRFPVVYICTYFVSFLLETVRSETQEQLNKLSNKYETLYRMDNLTELPNRYALDSYVESLSKVSKSKGVLIIDLDFFKKVNDNYGHDVGDAVLIEMAKIFKANVGDSDSVYRWGGEEFVVIVDNVSNTKTVAEKLIDAVAKHEFEALPADNNRMTISIGCAEGVIDDKADFSDLFTEADNRLYKAKEEGRNRFVFD